MIVTCGSCKTKFRLDPSKLKKPKGKVRCSRCGNVFAVESPPGEDEDMMIHVDLSDDGPEDDGHLDDSYMTPQKRPATNKKKLIGLTLMIVVPVLLLGAGAFFFLSSRSGSHSESPAPQSPSTAPASTPAPAKGPAPAAQAEQAAITIMDTTQAYFQQNAHSGQLFVVEGEVRNESRKPVSFVFLEGRLYSKTNQVSKSQRFFAGNMMTRDELAHLSIAEIQNRMGNREGKNMADVKVPPGNRVPFMLVFNNLPEMDAMADYSVEVISAKIDE